MKRSATSVNRALNDHHAHKRARSRLQAGFPLPTKVSFLSTFAKSRVLHLSEHTRARAKKTIEKEAPLCASFPLRRNASLPSLAEKRDLSRRSRVSEESIANGTLHYFEIPSLERKAGEAKKKA